jgi:enoyl-CoA hydratase/carnithine racemase
MRHIVDLRNYNSPEGFEELSTLLSNLAGDEKVRIVIFCGVETDLSDISAIAISQLCKQLDAFPTPVIAVVNETAADGGSELALACHLRMASTTASLKLVTGESLSAQEAYERGLVNRVFAPAELLPEVMALADEVAQLAPLSIRACLRAVTEGSKLPLSDGLALETELFASLFTTEDAKEGTRAFLEKSPPHFKGR